MIKFKNYLLFLVLFFNQLACIGQKETDSLYQKNFDELFEIYNSESNLKKRENYIEIWVKKAKKENNIEKLLVGYEIGAIQHKEEKSLKYLDSILLHSLKDKKYDDYSSSAYRMKGEYYYQKRKFKKEIKSYLLAKKYADRSKNPIMSFFIEYNIGLIKDRNGLYEEAIKIHKKNFLYAKKGLRGKINYSYIQSIYALANSYNYLNKTDSASHYNRLGYSESIKLKETKNKPYFILNQGITHYFNKEYYKALDSLLKASSIFFKKKDLPNSSESYYYLAKSYKEIGQYKKSINYFKKVDTIFRKTNDLLPALRDTYQHLTNYAEKEGQLKNQIEYTNQQIKLDSVLYTNKIFIDKNLIKGFDIPKLISNKEKLINKLKDKERKSNLFLMILFITITISIGISYYQYKKRKIYKKKFNEIISNKDSENKIQEKITSDSSITVPKEIIDDILSKLELFENNKGFTTKKITLNSLAKNLDTNTNYLSKVINFYKKTSFSNYLNTLRINFIIKKLKEDRNMRKYTIKAIAEEAGFGHPESFSKAFLKIKKIKPSYFLRELDRLDNKN